MSMYDIYICLRSLAVFRSVLNDPVISALSRYLKTLSDGDDDASVNAYCEFVSELYKTRCDSLSEHVRNIVFNDENVYIRCVGANKKPTEMLENEVKNELSKLQLIADLTSDSLTESLGARIVLPKFGTVRTDLVSEYFSRCRNIEKYGYGIYADNRMFYLNEDGKIVPARYPDPITLADLIDYKREQQIIIDNTRALLSGKPAANILLTGDAGTGKSSTIKAVVNELSAYGLRILEIRKDQLRRIPAIIDELSENPLRFILFIDDLSFVKDDDNFSALKAILEGSVSAKSRNIAIYATSNRRHLVKEKFSDREGDDIHRNDTMQEIISLSDRFGIHITFQRPDKKTYLNIVHSLAAEHGIDIPADELDVAAERFALGRGNRSARAAKQFIDELIRS